jgi:hypothetical protein
MPIPGKLVLIAAVVALTGCGSTDKQWMKVGESYSTAEFRRDYAACSSGGTLDEACLRARGWVDVQPSRGDRAAETPPPPPPPPRSLRR